MSRDFHSFHMGKPIRGGAVRHKSRLNRVGLLDMRRRLGEGDPNETLATIHVAVGSPHFLPNSCIASSAKTPPVIMIGTNGAFAAISTLEIII
jgi:hypothetical protein